MIIRYPRQRDMLSFTPRFTRAIDVTVMPFPKTSFPSKIARQCMSLDWVKIAYILVINANIISLTKNLSPKNAKLNV